jgi:hypothetical protein
LGPSQISKFPGAAKGREAVNAGFYQMIHQLPQYIGQDVAGGVNGRYKIRKYAVKFFVHEISPLLNRGFAKTP